MLYITLSNCRRTVLSILFRRHADPWSRHWLHLHCPSSDHGACPAYWLHPAGACPATGMPSLFVCIFVSECSCQLCTQHVCILIAICDLGQLNNWFATFALYLPRPRLFNRFSMFTQHRCSMWRKAVASTPMETCEQIGYPALLCYLSTNISAKSLQPVLSPHKSLHATIHVTSTWCWWECLCFFVCLCVCLLFWQVCSRLFNCAQSPEHEQKKGHALSADAMPGSLESEEWGYIPLTSPSCIHTLTSVLVQTDTATGKNTYVSVASSA